MASNIDGVEVDERYYDTETERVIAVGKHGNQLVIIPDERERDLLIPVTLHATTRQQIRLRVENWEIYY